MNCKGMGEMVALYEAFNVELTVSSDIKEDLVLFIEKK